MTKRVSTSHTLAVACVLVLAGAGCASDTGDAAAAPQSAAPADTGPRMRTVEANGIKLRIAEMGQGPLVIFLHGFPESWYSWRHQLPATAKAGFHAVAPDLRGYGKSDKPAGVDDYDIHHLTADVVGLIDALGEKTAVVVGHDWGALVAWNAVLLHPDRFTAVAAMSVPYGGRSAASPLETMKKTYGDDFYYILYFQEPGVAEAELGEDDARSLRMIYLGASGQGVGTFIAEKPVDAKMLDGMVDPDPLPAFFDQDDLDLYAAAYATSGWHGPINRYRAQGLDAADIGQIEGGDLVQPAAFIGGELDPVRRFVPGADLYDFAPNHCKDFRGTTVVPGAGHWVQQEAPDDTNAALDRFLDDL